jgi:hypothetical protein
MNQTGFEDHLVQGTKARAHRCLRHLVFASEVSDVWLSAERLETRHAFEFPAENAENFVF